MSVVDPEALAHAACLGVCEGINAFHSFGQIAGDVTDQLEKLVLI